MYNIIYGDMSVRSLAHLLIGSFIFLVLNCMRCLYTFEINCQLLCLLLFSPTQKAVFSPCFIVSLVVQKLLSFIRSHLFIFAFVSITLGGGL